MAIEKVKLDPDIKVKVVKNIKLVYIEGCQIDIRVTFLRRLRYLFTNDLVGKVSELRISKAVLVVEKDE